MIDIYPGALGTGMSMGRARVSTDLIHPREFAEFLVGLCATKSFFCEGIKCAHRTSRLKII